MGLLFGGLNEAGSLRAGRLFACFTYVFLPGGRQYPCISRSEACSWENVSSKDGWLVEFLESLETRYIGVKFCNRVCVCSLCSMASICSRFDIQLHDFLLDILFFFHGLPMLIILYLSKSIYKQIIDHQA